MNQTPSSSLPRAVSGAGRHRGFLLLASLAATLAALFYLLGLLQDRSTIALVSFAAGGCFATACRIRLGPLSRRWQHRFTDGAAAAAPRFRTAEDAFDGGGVWQEIDGNRDLLHLLHERGRRPPEDPQAVTHSHVVQTTPAELRERARPGSSARRATLDERKADE